MKRQEVFVTISGRRFGKTQELRERIQSTEGRQGDRYLLPCGNVGVWEWTGWRCMTCLGMYGSLGCPCTPPQSATTLPQTDAEQ